MYRDRLTKRPPTEAALLRLELVLWLETASAGQRIVPLADEIRFDDVYRTPCGQATDDDKRDK
jgi:hypothetical protein